MVCAVSAFVYGSVPVMFEVKQVGISILTEGHCGPVETVVSTLTWGVFKLDKTFNAFFITQDLGRRKKLDVH